MKSIKYVVAASLAVAVASSARAASYTFTNVADTNTAAPIGTLSSFSYPSISGGTAAFQASYNGPSSGAFTGNGGALTTIAKTGDASPIGTITAVSFVTIDGGTTAVSATAIGEYGVFTGSGGALTTIAKTGDASPIGIFNVLGPSSINGGTTVFQGQAPGANGIFTGSGGALTTIVKAGDAAPIGTFQNFGFPAISGGTTAVEGVYNANASSGVFTGSGGALTTIAKTGDAAPTGTFIGFSASMSISGGTTAFEGAYNAYASAGIFTGSGGALTTIVKSGDPAPIGTFDAGGFSPPAINGGTTAFEDSYGSGAGEGIFTGNGGSLTPVIETGESLFGSTVTGLGINTTGLDSNGDIAFWYTLSDGRTGVAIANISVVPEPASLCILGLGASMLLTRRRRNA